jgi:hypothetical protein
MDSKLDQLIDYETTEQIMDSKNSQMNPLSKNQRKHQKYVDFYDNIDIPDKEYWGIGIENESYIMLKSPVKVSKEFVIKNHRRERYSVDYWVNYKDDPLRLTLERVPSHILIPQYINGYQFQKTDISGEHITLYTKEVTPNPKFNGKTINKLLIETSPVFNTLFDKNMIYDGDTFEFTTFNFYKTTTQSAVEELKEIKEKFLKEINDKKIFKEEVVFPDHNYGFAKFLTNPNNLAICNNGTYHINITLPTSMNEKGEIKYPDNFKKVHANAIRAIQWIEPLLVALYGSPDILHILNPVYSGGSQRLGFSRYIGLGTYDTNTMEKGKLLDTFKYKEKKSYFTELHKCSPYNPPETTGYDFNYNKFTKHGIELRIFDYFPEKYLEHIINLIIIVCDFSTTRDIPPVNETWSKMAVDAINKGSDFRISPREYNEIYNIFGLHNCLWTVFNMNQTPLHILRRITNCLYHAHRNSPLCKKMSPDMKGISIVDYNSKIKEMFKKDLKKI